LLQAIQISHHWYVLRFQPVEPESRQRCSSHDVENIPQAFVPYAFSSTANFPSHPSRQTLSGAQFVACTAEPPQFLLENFLLPENIHQITT
jgi:hypothetical protein